ncbi:MAG: Maf family protein [Deltaproteobacteria bacterium]|nr:Maf family protein [Deltaproteobacteria bacterium]
MTARPPMVLASASPRRRELLAAAGLDFLVRPADVDESPVVGEEPMAQALRLAKAKALAVASGHPDSLILSADTVVVLNGKIYGKPRSLSEAKGVLKALQGHSHEVVTAYCLIAGDGRPPLSRATVSKVAFRPLTDREIDLYLEKGESLDKAGAYAIQGHGLGLIQEVEGSLTNVMGLPLSDVLAALEELQGPPPA